MNESICHSSVNRLCQSSQGGVYRDQRIGAQTRPEPRRHRRKGEGRSRCRKDRFKCRKKQTRCQSNQPRCQPYKQTEPNQANSFSPSSPSPFPSSFFFLRLLCLLPRRVFLFFFFFFTCEQRSNAQRVREFARNLNAINMKDLGINDEQQAAMDQQHQQHPHHQQQQQQQPRRRRPPPEVDKPRKETLLTLTMMTITYD